MISEENPFKAQLKLKVIKNRFLDAKWATGVLFKHFVSILQQYWIRFFPTALKALLNYCLAWIKSQIKASWFTIEFRLMNSTFFSSSPLRAFWTIDDLKFRLSKCPIVYNMFLNFIFHLNIELLVLSRKKTSYQAFSHVSKLLFLVYGKNYQFRLGKS